MKKACIFAPPLIYYISEPEHLFELKLLKKSSVSTRIVRMVATFLRICSGSIFISSWFTVISHNALPAPQAQESISARNCSSVIGITVLLVCLISIGRPSPIDSGQAAVSTYMCFKTSLVIASRLSAVTFTVLVQLFAKLMCTYSICRGSR